MKKYIYLFLLLFSVQAMAGSFSSRSFYRTPTRTSIGYSTHRNYTSGNSWFVRSRKPMIATTRKAPVMSMVQSYRKVNMVAYHQPQTFSQAHPMLSGMLYGFGGAWLYNKFFGEEQDKLPDNVVKDCHKDKEGKRACELLQVSQTENQE